MNRRILVTGSRTWEDRMLIQSVLSNRIRGSRGPTVLMHGACPRGADKIAHEIAPRLGYLVESYPADWKRHGKAAGPIRNHAMLDREPDLVLAFIRGESPGTRGCVAEARKRGIPVVAFRHP